MTQTGDSGLLDLAGRTVDRRYVLREWLGGGGFGGVYRAEQYILGRPVRSVACKLSRATGVREDTAAELFADVLLQAEVLDGLTDAEARAHLVQVFDGGLAPDLGGRAFLVMEYVRGSTLADEFAAMERVPQSQMLKWARQICVALRGLHSLVPPLLHRDLKPDNVLLGTDRTVRLIDFGLSARLLESGDVRGTVGTADYMAPETADGASLPASDIYSLGLLVYEGLTGRHAYAHLLPPRHLPMRSYANWLRDRKSAGPPPKPSAYNNSVGPELDDLVMRCLELRPADRFATAADLLADLDALAAADAAEQGAAPGAPRGARARAGEPQELADARAARAAGDPARAVAGLGRLLARQSGASLAPWRAAVLAELACAHEDLHDHGAAARGWADAYHEVRRGAPVPRGESRAGLAARAEAAFREAGNAFQADRFARLSRTEQGRR
ncbi:serine/threonine-protein kinase [Streptomyces sp. NPDC050560]|uniref:serine/threonine-protein kinase n=1 Tax=Streptomyces sp. NPDC050560 TaxID=3365630 RepID=UPI0037AFC9CF